MNAEPQSAPQGLKPKLWSILLLAAPAIVAQGSLYGGNNGWTNVGPEGGSFWQLAVDPQDPAIIYGLTGAGLFTSTDGGAHWVETKPGIPAFPAALAVDPQTPSTVYAAIATGGLWKSVNGGANWRNVFPANVYAVTIDPQNSATICLGTDNGLARSTDGGETWAPIPGGPGRVSVLALDPQDPNTVYAGGPGGLFAVPLASSFTLRIERHAKR